MLKKIDESKLEKLELSESILYKMLKSNCYLKIKNKVFLIKYLGDFFVESEVAKYKNNEIFINKDSVSLINTYERGFDDVKNKLKNIDIEEYKKVLAFRFATTGFVRNVFHFVQPQVSVLPFMVSYFVGDLNVEIIKLAREQSIELYFKNLILSSMTILILMFNGFLNLEEINKIWNLMMAVDLGLETNTSRRIIEGILKNEKNITILLSEDEKKNYFSHGDRAKEILISKNIFQMSNYDKFFISNHDFFEKQGLSVLSDVEVAYNYINSWINFEIPNLEVKNESAGYLFENIPNLKHSFFGKLKEVKELVA